MTTTAYATAFAGIHGSAVSNERASDKVNAVDLPQGSMLLDPAGAWAVRLQSFSAHVAETLLTILRDNANQMSSGDQPLLRRVQAYDESSAKDSHLTEDIAAGINALDALARKLTQRRYTEISERAMRRSLLSQARHLPLMQRLMIS